jgi:hypothetical protein
VNIYLNFVSVNIHQYSLRLLQIIVKFTFFQQILLQDLYDTKMCNSLLFPEADEDIWKHEDLRMSVSPIGIYITKSDGEYLQVCAKRVKS